MKPIFLKTLITPIFLMCAFFLPSCDKLTGTGTVQVENSDARKFKVRGFIRNGKTAEAIPLKGKVSIAEESKISATLSKDGEYVIDGVDASLLKGLQLYIDFEGYLPYGPVSTHISKKKDKLVKIKDIEINPDDLKKKAK